MAFPPDRSAADSLAATPDDLSAWMVAYGPGLRRYFQRRAGPADAEDLVQEVFLRLQARREGGSVGNIERYLFRIANNVLISRYRAGQARGQGTAEALDEANAPIEEVSPERILIGKQEMARAVVAMRNLPPRAREAFIFHRFNEMTYPAIAARMGISVSAVGELIMRALERLTEETRRP